MSLSRSELQQLAEIRISEAGLLLANGMWDGAYYLAGYAVECGLKACIMAHVERTGIIFEDKKFSEKCWTHDFEVLLDLAGLKDPWKVDRNADPLFAARWAEVAVWKESRRYVRSTELDARVLILAITDPSHGVLQWIRRHW